MGGIDWAGFPLLCALLGVPDPDLMVERLHAIKTHRPPDLPGA